MAQGTLLTVNRLRAERKGRGITMSQLARLTGLSEAAISLYETGRRNPSRLARERIAKEMRLTPEYLFPASYGIEENPEAVA